MKLDKLNPIIQQLTATGEIRIADIPDIDLYMDQVTTFIDNKLGNDKRDKKDKLLTKTMINNYSKAKILTPSKSKKYNKQQMIQLILIYYLKQVLSISDIQDIFKPLFHGNNQNEALVNEVYHVFLHIKKSSLENVSSMLDEMSAMIAETAEKTEDQNQEDVQMLLTVLLLTAQAQAYKRTAEAIIDSYFKKENKA